MRNAIQEELLEGLRERKRLEEKTRELDFTFFDEQYFARIFDRVSLDKDKLFIPFPENSYKLSFKGTDYKKTFSILGIFNNNQVRYQKRSFSRILDEIFPNQHLDEGNLVPRILADKELVGMMVYCHSFNSILGLLSDDYSDFHNYIPIFKFGILERPVLIVPHVFNYEYITRFERRNKSYLPLIRSKESLLVLQT